MRGGKGEGTRRGEGGKCFSLQTKAPATGDKFQTLFPVALVLLARGMARTAARSSAAGAWPGPAGEESVQGPAATGYFPFWGHAQCAAITRGASWCFAGGGESSGAALCVPTDKSQLPALKHQLKAFNFWVARPLFNLFSPLLSDSVTYS